MSSKGISHNFIVERRLYEKTLGSASFNSVHPLFFKELAMSIAPPNTIKLFSLFEKFLFSFSC